MSLLIAAFVAAASIAFFATHYVRGWATEAGIVDEPDGVRRLHPDAVPRLGGVAIFGTVATVGVLLTIRALVLDLAPPAEVTPLVGILVGATAIFALGLWDDISGLDASTKFLVQTLVAVGAFAAGVRVQGFGLPGGGGFELPVAADLAITVIWIVGITNAFNLVDGSDGVAGGAAIFASATVAVVSILNGNEFAALFALTLAGATLGFLFFNFPPASIFLGDGGSLFLGFTLASLGLLSAQKATTAVAVAIPVVSFGLPILDTLLAMGRRLLRGEPIFRGDRGHIHHRLRDLGHSPRKVALLLYALCGAFALLSLLLVQPTQSSVTAVLIVAGAVVWISIQRLHIPELVEFQKVLDRSFRQRSVIANNVRIREATQLMEFARSPDEVAGALRHALDSREFERVEIWLSGDRARPLADSVDLVREGEGYAWSFAESEDAPPAEIERHWEVRFQICGHPDEATAGDGAGRNRVAVGRISLWPARDNEHLLIDLRLIAMELLPAFERSLERMGGRAPVRRTAARRPAETPPRPDDTAAMREEEEPVGVSRDLRAVSGD